MSSNNNNDEHICIYANEIENLKHDSERNSQQHREFYDKFGDLVTKQVLADERYNNILAVQNEIKNSVTDLKEKPAKRWDSITLSIITSVLGLILGYILNIIVGR